MILLLGKVCAQLSTCLHLWGLCSNVTFIAWSLSVLLILYFSSIYLATTWHISCALSVCFLFILLFSKLSHTYLFQSLAIATGPLHLMFALLEIFFSTSFPVPVPCYFTYLVPSTTFILAWMSLHQRCLAWSITLVSILYDSLKTYSLAFIDLIYICYYTLNYIYMIIWPLPC